MIRFNQILDRIGNKEEIHAKLLNTLSLIEYIGARKIIKSQPDHHLNSELLLHVAEEIRHSIVLKKLALKLSNNMLQSYSDSHLLGGASGKNYIQTVDHSISQTLSNNSDKWINYLLTTLLIEERAAEIYPLYNTYLESLGFQNRLTSIVRDESKHLRSVLAHLSSIMPSNHSKMVQLREIETVAFNQFLETILKSLDES